MFPKPVKDGIDVCRLISQRLCMFVSYTYHSVFFYGFRFKKPPDIRAISKQIMDIFFFLSLYTA